MKQLPKKEVFVSLMFNLIVFASLKFKCKLLSASFMGIFTERQALNSDVARVEKPDAKTVVSIVASY